MAIFRWGHAWDAFHDLEQEVDRLLAGVSLTFQGVRFGRQYPAVNVYDHETELLITAELPGVKSEDLELTIADGVLTLRGKRSGTEGVPDERYRRQERPRGQWQRSLSLPERIQEDQLAAEFANGVLKIHLPKAPSTQPRQIRITEGSSE
jgi:HSP20 family protein